MTIRKCDLHPSYDDGGRKTGNPDGEYFLFPFMKQIIAELEQQGKVRTSETYLTALHSLQRFRVGNDIRLSELDNGLALTYEYWLKSRLSRNSSSFYLRILRATYNRAVNRGLTDQRFPFRQVYTGVEKTIKRALPIETIRKIKEMELSPLFSYVRDLFLFSFYTRGMSFVDMAYLEKKNLSNDVLSYRRKKTGQMMYVYKERCIGELIDRYGIPDSPYLLPIIRDPKKDVRRQYLNEEHRVNECLKKIGKLLDLPLPLTFYVARHSWASAAHKKNIPISVISEGMGHNSEETTRIYLASLDREVIDEANRIVLRSL